MKKASEEEGSRKETIMKSRSLLKHSGVKVKRERDSLTFIIPADKAEKIIKECNFSWEQLKVGGDIPLSELAVHLDEQASLEARVGYIAEVARYALENAKTEFEAWQEQTYYKVRSHLEDTGHKSGLTENYIRGYMRTKYPKEMRKKESEISTLEFQYRLLNNVIRSAVITKGTLLPSLRNIIQGSNSNAEGIKSIEVRVENKIRNKLKV